MLTVDCSISYAMGSIPTAVGQQPLPNTCHESVVKEGLKAQTCKDVSTEKAAVRLTCPRFCFRQNRCGRRSLNGG